jgi:hypothetical protein
MSSQPVTPPPAIWFKVEGWEPLKLYVEKLEKDYCFTAGDLRAEVKRASSPRLDHVPSDCIVLFYHDGKPVEKDTLVAFLINVEESPLIVHVNEDGS